MAKDKITQDLRLLSLSTPLGKDVLCLHKLEGTEAISSPFHFCLELLSDQSSTVSFKDIVGKRVTIAIELPSKQKRYINGLVSRFAQGDFDTGMTHYYAEVVPWLWLLSRTSDCRIFQKKSVPDIVQQIFKDLGLQDFKLQLQGSFEPREFCVQYRETDLDFVSRLLEEEGIFYFFEHTQDKHTLVLANSPAAHSPCPNQAQARYRYTYGGKQEVDFIRQWKAEQELHPGKYALTDYYFPTPSNNQMVKAVSGIKLEGSDRYEVYDYPGYFAKRFDGDDKAGKVPPDGERTVKIRMAANEAAHQVIEGAGECRGFVPGYRFSLTEHYRQDLNGDYVLTQVTHTASNNLRPGDEPKYQNTFTCLPKAVPYRPARVTPKPVIQGTQTAQVVGLAGEEIDTDKYGRVKVQFPWDREGKKDANSSCWIRVASSWSGKQWGAIQIPRIGQEVVVSFLEGDPDQPLIIGSVYNAEQMPPYKLPDNKTQSGVKSRSSLKGGAENYNEIYFEDKKGEELLYIRAEKDQTIAVENDEAHWVGHDRTKEVDHDETTTIKNNRTETVEEGDEKITIKKGNRTVEISMGNETLNIKMGNQTTTLDMGNQATQLKMGNQTTKLDMGQSSTEAMQSIELKVGQSSIKVDQTGVTISGMVIKIEGQVQTQLKGLMTQLGGDAMLQVQGGIIMIG
jgi:type VI secretion system secreted protein VgrG